jgi:hypothetical protein
MVLYSLTLCIAYTSGVKKSVGRGVKANAMKICHCCLLVVQTKRVTTKAKTTPSTVRARVKTVLLLLCACGKISLAPI